MTKEGALFLVHFNSEPLTLDQVKSEIEKRYNDRNDSNNIKFNTESIILKDGSIEVKDNILSPEDWNIVKKNGKKDIPFRITLVKDGSTKGNCGKGSGNQLVKIAMYGDGTTKLEDLRSN